MSLSDFTTDQLLAEVRRRAEEAERERPIERWCNGCDHWHYSDGDNDLRPNCKKLHHMTFRMPIDWPDDETWGHYRRNCGDWIERSPDAPGPNLAPAAPAPPAPSPPRRHSTRQPKHHADAITTPAPPGAAPMLHPMHKRPRPGQRFAVHMKNSTIRHQCHASRVVGDGIDAIVIYHGKWAIDEGDALGWWPEARP